MSLYPLTNLGHILDLKRQRAQVVLCVCHDHLDGEAGLRLPREDFNEGELRELEVLDARDLALAVALHRRRKI